MIVYYGAKKALLDVFVCNYKHYILSDYMPTLKLFTMQNRENEGS